MALSRNFRTTYYKTLGVPVVQHIVDVEASFAAILSERAVNVPQLLKVALELGIAPPYRARSWLLLAGILPPYPGLWSFVLMERRAMFEDVVEAAQVLHEKDVMGSDEGNGVYYNFTELLEEMDDVQNEELSSVLNRKRLVHLHRIYWGEFAMCEAPLLRGMDDANYLLGVARAVCDVLTDEAERFWVFTRLLELFNDGLESVDPMVPLSTLHDAQLADFEVVFLRTLDVKRRRQAADGSTSSLHMRKSGHD
uniref:TBC1 domain family member 7 n=1 Tax=Peronospora matthiolae TaxID=2874970 RepID=A0AAV1V0X7_9STRA